MRWICTQGVHGGGSAAYKSAHGHGRRVYEKMMIPECICLEGKFKRSTMLMIYFITPVLVSIAKHRCTYASITLESRCLLPFDDTSEVTICRNTVPYDLRARASRRRALRALLPLPLRSRNHNLLRLLHDRLVRLLYRSVPVLKVGADE